MKEFRNFRKKTDATVDEVLLVVAAMKRCPSKLFAYDVRAEGWEGGMDRSQLWGTLVVQRRWEDRLTVATRWDSDGRPGAKRKQTAFEYEPPAEAKTAFEIECDKAFQEGGIEAMDALIEANNSIVDPEWCESSTSRTGPRNRSDAGTGCGRGPPDASATPSGRTRRNAVTAPTGAGDRDAAPSHSPKTGGRHGQTTNEESEAAGRQEGSTETPGEQSGRSKQLSQEEDVVAPASGSVGIHAPLRSGTALEVDDDTGGVDPAWYNDCDDCDGDTIDPYEHWPMPGYST